MLKRNTHVASKKPVKVSKKQAAKKPVAKAKSKPAAKPTPKPVKKKPLVVKKPISKTKPAAKKAPAKPVKKLISKKPVVKKVLKAVKKPAAKPVAKKTSAAKKPVALVKKKPIALVKKKPVVAHKKPASKPITKPIAKPIKKVAKAIAKKPVVKPVAKSATKPVVSAKPLAKADTKPVVKADVKPVAKPEVIVAAVITPVKPAPKGKVSSAKQNNKQIERVKVSMAPPAKSLHKSGERAGFVIRELPAEAALKQKSVKRVTLPSGYKPSEKEEYMSDMQLEYFRQKLIEERETLLSATKETINELKEEARDVGDEAERASRETENFFELRTRDRYRKLLYKIEKIITAIDDGTYGYCVDTGEEIGLKRLEGRPMAERTVDAQERWEHKKKQLGD